jgi:hypothetical protein
MTRWQQGFEKRVHTAIKKWEAAINEQIYLRQAA